MRAFSEFAFHYNFLNPGGSPFPASEEALVWFVAYLSQSVAYGTIKSYLSAVRSHHVDYGLDVTPFLSLRLKRIRYGARRLSAPSQDRRLPITPRILLDIFRTVDLQDYNDSLHWAACCLAFFGFLRCAEFTIPSSSSFDPSQHLGVSDVLFDSACFPSMLSLLLRTSKTDQFRQGVSVVIGRTQSPVCAVRAVAHFLCLRGNTPGPLFVFREGQALSRQSFTCFLRHRLAACGHLGFYAGHSFRIGAATTAAAAGVPAHIIKAMGRWKSEAYLAYIRISPDILRAVAAQMSGQV